RRRMGPRTALRYGADLPELRGGEDGGAGEGAGGGGRGPPEARDGGGLDRPEGHDRAVRDETADDRRGQVHAPLPDDLPPLERGPEHAVDLTAEEAHGGGDQDQERARGDRRLDVRHG